MQCGTGGLPNRTQEPLLFGHKKQKPLLPELNLSSGMVQKMNFSIEQISKTLYFSWSIAVKINTTYFESNSELTSF